jgi:hypothetical protein
MPFGSFLKLVKGFTSDHTYQTVTIEAQTPENNSVVLTGLTWNLMNQCHSAEENHGSSNNPFDLDEELKEYLKRKSKQLAFILGKIVKGNVDFMFLQEVDIFTREPRPKITQIFIEKLRSIGWDLVISDVSDNLKQPVVTLYNTQKLQFAAKRSLFKTHADLFTSLEAEFKYKATGEQVCLTNMHLDFKSDHTQDIEIYQRSQYEKDVITIIGGDANSHSGVDYRFFVGDENMPTCIFAFLQDEGQ